MGNDIELSECDRSDSVIYKEYLVLNRPPTDRTLNKKSKHVADQQKRG